MLWVQDQSRVRAVISALQPEEATVGPRSGLNGHYAVVPALLQPCDLLGPAMRCLPSYSKRQRAIRMHAKSPYGSIADH